MVPNSRTKVREFESQMFSSRLRVYDGKMAVYGKRIIKK